VVNGTAVQGGCSRAPDDAARGPGGSTGRIYTMEGAAAEKDAESCRHIPRTDFARERFVLRLDTQFVDLDNEDDIALETVLDSVKNRVILAISASAENSLATVLASSSDEERAVFESLKYPGRESVEAFKKAILDDIDFLVQREILARPGGHQSILDMIGRDIIRARFSRGESEYRMNSETLDALFKKSLLLKEDLDLLYRYADALLRAMATNKSGVFLNRQCGGRSLYGTYRYRLDRLDPCIFEDINSANLHFVISMESPLVFSLDIMHGDEVWQSLRSVRFDELLRLREDGIKCFDVNEVMTCSVRLLIDIVNEQYVRC